MSARRIEQGPAYSLLFLAACGGAIWHHSLTPEVVLASMRLLGGSEGLPAGLLLATRLGNLLYCLPFGIVALFALSFKASWLRTMTAIAFQGSALAAAYLAYAWLLYTPYLLVNAGYANKHPENVLSADAQNVLNGAETLELFALSPEKGSERAPTRETFHGYVVRGKFRVTDQTQRMEVVEAIQQGIKGSNGRVAMCFIPRHGLRVKKGTSQLDMIICYECRKIEVHHDGKPDAVATTATSEAKLNELLHNAEIPRNPEPNR